MEVIKKTQEEKLLFLFNEDKELVYPIIYLSKYLKIDRHNVYRIMCLLNKKNLLYKEKHKIDKRIVYYGIKINEYENP